MYRAVCTSDCCCEPSTTVSEVLACLRAGRLDGLHIISAWVSIASPQQMMFDALQYSFQLTSSARSVDKQQQQQSNLTVLCRATRHQRVTSELCSTEEELHCNALAVLGATCRQLQASQAVQGSSDMEDMWQRLSFGFTKPRGIIGLHCTWHRFLEFTEISRRSCRCLNAKQRFTCNTADLRFMTCSC